MYKVIKSFNDLHDNHHNYNPGDVFPREGLVVSEERLAELSTDKNRIGTPFIEFIEDQEPKKASEKKSEPEKQPEKKETVKKTAKKTATKKK